MPAPRPNYHGRNIHFRQIHCSLSKQANKHFHVRHKQRLCFDFTTSISESWRAECLSQVSVNRCQGHRSLRNLLPSWPRRYEGMAPGWSGEPLLASSLTALRWSFQQVRARLLNPQVGFNDSTSNWVNPCLITTRNNSWKNCVKTSCMAEYIPLTYCLPNPANTLTLRWAVDISALTFSLWEIQPSSSTTPSPPSYLEKGILCFSFLEECCNGPIHLPSSRHGLLAEQPWHEATALEHDLFCT